MLNARAYDSYFGGKSGSGTYQTIINLIPPHKAFYSLFLGNCGIVRKIRPADFTLLNDIDPVVMSAWERLNLSGSMDSVYKLMNDPAVDILRALSIFHNDVALTGGELPEDRFIFLDPPYLKDTRKSQVDTYRFEMSVNDHADLLSQIYSMHDHKIMICHYPCSFYDEHLQGWHVKDYFSMTRNGLAQDRLYFNYDPPRQLHDYGFIGGSFREREKFNRIRSNMVSKLNRLPDHLRFAILSDIASR